MIYILSVTILYGLFPFSLYLLINKLDNKIKNVIPFIFLVFLSSIYEFIFTILLRFDVSYWFLSYCVISYFTIYYFFNTLLYNTILNVNFLSLLLFIFLLISLLSFFEIKDTLIICSFLDGFTTIYIFIFSILWFRKIFQDLEYESLLYSPHFYFISGLILYYFGSFFLFLLSNLINERENKMFQYYWMLNVVLNLVLRTLLIVGIWKARVK